jgi:hypothetical protein
MVRSRGESPLEGDATLLPASVPDIGRSLQLARAVADLTLPEAAARAGLTMATLEALESGSVGHQHDRIQTLRALRTYANSLGLPGNDYVLVAVEQWPSAEVILKPGGDTAVVPVVSISSAPAGGHHPAGEGSVWPVDATGVPDATTTGVIAAVRPRTLTDTGQVPVVDTGEVPAVRLPVPRFLKMSVGVVAFLVVLGGIGLLENAHLEGWAHDSRTTTTHWYNNVKSALGLTSGPATPAHHTAAPPVAPKTHRATKAGKVTMKADPSGLAVNINVAAASFTVRIVAATGPCWVEATTAGHPQPLYAQVIPAGGTHDFAVTKTMTIETGSSAGRAFLYQGTKLIGYYFPTRVPFKMNFATVS